MLACCMKAYVEMCVRACVLVCMCEGQRTTSDVSPSLPSSREGLSTGSFRLAGQWASRALPLSPSHLAVGALDFQMHTTAPTVT